MPEQRHLTDALCFELGKVKSQSIRELMTANLAQVDAQLARAVASSIGVAAPTGGVVAAPSTSFKGRSIDASPLLSIEQLKGDSIKTRKIAILVADGVDEADVTAIKKALAAEGAVCDVIAKTLGAVTGSGGGSVPIDTSAITVDSVMYDAVYIPGGSQSAAALKANAKALYFIAEAFAHSKPIAASGAGVSVLAQANLAAALAGTRTNEVMSELGVVTTSGAAHGGEFASAFIAAIAQHRFWDRPGQDQGSRV